MNASLNISTMISHDNKARRLSVEYGSCTARDEFIDVVTHAR